MKRYIASILTLLSVAAASAQVAPSEAEVRTSSRGLLLNRDVMSLAEMGTLSRSQFQFGSARSMAMAGAMTSLGGDATSMMINPAGLGMARTNSFTLTPMISIQSSEVKGSSPYSDNGRAPFALSDFAAVINIYESGLSKLLSLNLGLGYNRIADLNYGYSLSSPGSNGSIANVFSRQLTKAGVSLNSLFGENNPDWSTMPTYLYGASLGYKTGLTFQSRGDIPSGYYDTDPDASEADNYREHIESSPIPVWGATWIGSGAKVDQYMAVESDGSIGEYDLAIGGNLDNKLYFGFTLGIQSVQQRLDLIYGEEYHLAQTLDNELQYSNYNQAIITSGTGVNLKVGATYRPTEALRIGFAYHSPTWYSLDRSYQGSMASKSIFKNKVERYSAADSRLLEDFYANKWKYRSPSKLLIGGSYTFAQRALISVDYQYENFGNLTTRNVPGGVSMEIYNSAEDIFQAVNTLRIGGEMKFTPSIALRGGYGISSAMVRSDVESSQLLDIPATNKMSYFAAGVGYSPNAMLSFDLTYMNCATESTDYKLFYSEGTVSPTAAQSNSYSNKMTQHNIALSMVVKM